jgi:hypothetical protein
VGSHRRPKQEKEIIHMKAKLVRRITLGLAASAVILVTAADATPNPPIPPTPEGVWGVTRYYVNCQNHQDLGPFYRLIMTFTKTDGDNGTVLAQSYGSFPDNAYGSAEMGVWQKGRGPGHTFTFRNLSYGYDNNGQFNGYTIATGTGELTGANAFNASATVDVYDADGNLLFTGCGRATATRFE